MSDLISRHAAIETVRHSIYDFFDVVEDDEESPITEKDKMLLELNKALCNNIKELQSAEITQADVELYCRRRCLTVITNELFEHLKQAYNQGCKDGQEALREEMWENERDRLD